MTTKRFERPDADAILSQLKDFQRDTVEHVFSRLYRDDPPQHRYLVADEVGLGKTLVARGVIAKTLEHLWDRVDRIDVIYICSNLDIARQNVNRMNVMGRDDFALASRITMLPTLTHRIAQNKFNFVSFTPDTSFEIGQTAGRKEERLLLHHLLERAWGLTGAGAKNVLQGAVRDAERFRRDLRDYLSYNDIDDSLAEAFARSVEDKVRQAKAKGEPDLRTRFDELCRLFARTRTSIPAEERKLQSAWIGEMRAVLARTCIRALEPDLVILDEFQRFKTLLDGKDDASLLAKELFDYEHQDGRARVLLLSATPYKMYTTPDGATDEDHYADFLQTLSFLQDDPSATDRVRGVLERYRRALLRLGPDTQPQLAEMKATLEDELRRVMVRTERLAVSEDRNGMLREVPAELPAIEAGSVRTYHTLQRLAKSIEHHDTLEYWKAAPYLLNFMTEYKFKRALMERLEDGDGEELAAALTEDKQLVLDQGVLRGKQALEPPHARLQWLLDQTVGADLWKLLWLPPSLPYYELGGPFAEAARRGVTKRLVFSAWRVVPRALASLLSYEAERRMLADAATDRRSLDDARNRVVPLLRFTRTEGRLTGMPVLGLVYPSFALSALGDPLDPYYRTSGGRTPSQATLLTAIKARIRPLLEPIVADRAESRGPVDEAWYWAAPILLDLQMDERAARSWLLREGAGDLWIGEADDDDAESENRLWLTHVEEAIGVLSRQQLGPAPEDLLDVLALQALAGPAVTALRAISRFTGGERAQRRDYVRDAAGSVAWGVRNLFNLPDTIALVRMLCPGEPYWQRVLEYCAIGGLQAVLDEYLHILPESLGLIGLEPEDVADKVAEEVRNAIGLRTAPVGVDEIRVAPNGAVEREQKRMRSRFAVRFGDNEAEASDGGDARTRSGQLRSAFNSPFWPFVLATTTVGQEGLDFHQYCHAVVHWNLPSNPVDLEQREGRVHRYKGHAVRKNIARRYGRDFMAALDVGEEDPWRAVFDIARDARAAGTSDIVPYWVFPLEGGAAVERHVPALPLSEDLERLDALRRTLAVYRMVFGQPRQDELLGYLLRRMEREEAVSYLADLRIDLAPVRDATVAI
jgi:hypothetical protein